MGHMDGECVVDGTKQRLTCNQMLFNNSSSVSKTTGADKRTSAFLFGNKAATSSVKKGARKDN
jgi:hypothetical protein